MTICEQTCYNLFTDVQQPPTQALHCFYRDQWQLINAKRARVRGQRATKKATISSRVLT